MGKKGTKYTPEFRQQIVELVRAGRVPAQLAQEFDLSAWTVGHWVKQAARNEGKGDGGSPAPSVRSWHSCDARTGG